MFVFGNSEFGKIRFRNSDFRSSDRRKEIRAISRDLFIPAMNTSSASGSGAAPGELSAQATYDSFWPKQAEEIRNLDAAALKHQELPLARIKKIMKLDDDVKMISAEAPVLFAKAAEMFITELTMRAWIHTEDNKRRTLQRNDIAMAITK